MANQSPIALVTGGSRGLGKDMALSLAQKGFDVILTFHSNTTAANEVVTAVQHAGRRAVALQLDVADSANYHTFFQRVKGSLQQVFTVEKFDFLINNAGTGLYSSFTETTEAQFDDMVNVHLKSAYFLTQKALPLMNDGGGIINISTGLTRLVYPNYSAYAIVKSAVELLTKYQAKELGARKIRVNAVAPGAIETDFAGGTVRDNEHVNNHIASETALGRVGLPSDVGSVVAFLCSAEAYWINAQRIEVSGGQAI